MSSVESLVATSLQKNTHTIYEIPGYLWNLITYLNY